MQVDGCRSFNNMLEKMELCQSCNIESDHKIAECFCETCNESVCYSCLNRHSWQPVAGKHVIKPVDGLSKVYLDLCLHTCGEHKNQFLSFYCQKHDTVCCSECKAQEHSDCKVWPVSDFSCNYGNSTQLHVIKEKTEKLAKQLKNSKTEIQGGLEAALELKTKLVDELKTFRKEVNTYLDQAEEVLISEVEQLNAATVSMLAELQDECESFESKLEEVFNKLNQTSNKTEHLFITAKLVQRQLDTCQRLNEQIASKAVVLSSSISATSKDYKFEPSTHLKELMRQQCPLGSWATQPQTNVTRSQEPKHKVKTDFRMTDLQAKYKEKLNIQLDIEGQCCITGLAKISNDEILVADADNKSLKLLTLSEGKVTSMYIPTGRPFDVTVINSEMAAATIPQNGQILFVSTRNGLSYGRILNIRKNCKGIDHINSLLAVSFCGPAAVQVLDMEGNVLHNLSDATSLLHPCNISFTYDQTSIYVSDYAKCAVYKLNIDGHTKTVITYKMTNRPCGQVVTSDGTVTVCCTGDDEKVRMIIPNRRITLPLYLQDAQEPNCLLVCEEKLCLYVCQNRGSPDSNYIKIYELNAECNAWD